MPKSSSIAQAAAAGRTDRRKSRSRAGLLRLRQSIPDGVFNVAGFVVPVALVLVWWAVTALGLVKPLFLPSPYAILEEAWRQISTGILLQDASVSVYRILAGWLSAALLAIPIGILMGNFRLFEGALEPLISTIRYMPVVALIPLTILWAGIGDEQKILILFLGTFFQMALMVMDNVKTIDINLIRAGQTLGFSNTEILWRIILPAALPAIWDTCRITIGWTWTYLVVAELVAAQTGLGRRIMDAQRYLATDTIIFGTLFIGLLGLLTDYAFKRTGRSLFRWTGNR
ncbi:ABC transporter permease [Devosia sp. 1635]|uniref:ABC transporter permease n=1 Tax=Devosia sp. 1635 TaxID=2726066 RepID=UPI0015640EB7|nr:ABC transporter permease [Devosia sp. 1635]